jgi:hypothetical protein
MDAVDRCGDVESGPMVKGKPAAIDPLQGLRFSPVGGKSQVGSLRSRDVIVW